MFGIFSRKKNTSKNKNHRGDTGSKRDKVSGSHLSASDASQERTIRYDPALVSTLTSDHVKLVNNYLAIGSAFESEKYTELSQALSVFKTSFQSHIIKENVKFYVFLEQSLSSDQHSLEVVRDFRREMNTIASKVIQFCNYYSKYSFSAAHHVKFQQEYEAIKKALLHRIEREENDLYVLYHD